MILLRGYSFYGRIVVIISLKLRVYSKFTVLFDARWVCSVPRIKLLENLLIR